MLIIWLLRLNHLLVYELESSSVSVAIVASIQHHAQCILLHSGTETGSDGCRASHGGADVHLQQPGVEVTPQDEVCTIELEAGLTRLHAVLRRQESLDYGSSHTRKHHFLPQTTSTRSREPGAELSTRPHALSRQGRVTTCAWLEIFLNGVVAEMDRAER